MIMSGTTEGAQIIARMAALEDIKIVATTTTAQGAELARSAGAHDVISQSLDKAAIEELIESRKIDVLVDATHPFAQEATRNAIKAVDARGIEYIRFERPELDIPDNDLIFLVDSFEDAAILILELVEDVRILHLAGVMTLHYLTKRIDSKRIMARVLPSVYSLEKCFELGLPAENIIAMQGTFSKEFNKAFMEEYDISLMVTKESGEAGGTPSKIGAALELGIPVVIVMRPEVRELAGKKVFNGVDDVIQELVDLK
jgi:precorrin-6A/cobalt-precorrin-6A reductase